MAERALVLRLRSSNHIARSAEWPPPALILLLCLTVCLIASGCAGLNASDAPTSRIIPPAPEGKKLAELVGNAFKTTKLPGTPEVSSVRATHDAQWGDWVFCIKSNSSEQSPKYAVLTSDNTILEVRSAVSIDGCDKETYHHIEITNQHGDVDQSQPDAPSNSSRRHRTRAP